MVTTTQQIGRKAAASILHAPRTAKEIGRPLNIAVTINYWEFGVKGDRIFDEFSILRDRWFRIWSRYSPKNHGIKNGVPAYAYVHEAPDKLAHTHWLLHVHEDNVKRFEQKIVDWLKKRYNMKAIPSGALEIKEAYNPEGFKKYMVKGLDQHFAMLWNIKHVYQGEIDKRRADTP